MRIDQSILAFLGTMSLIVSALHAEEPAPTYRADSLAKDEPQAVYAANPDDAWNRIFYGLFTRTIKTRLSDDFPEGKPFGVVAVMGFPQLSVSRNTFLRIEGGDRAIEPLYPSGTGLSTTDLDGSNRAMIEPLYSQLTKALEDALHEKPQRPPLARALMQCDVWAAHDLLSRNYNFDGEEGKQRLERRNQLLNLLARLVKKLALTSDEIKTLPDNYAAAGHHLPDLFGASSEWLEVRWSQERIHDSAADYRRVARVFIKPASPPKDKDTFLNGLRHAENFPEHLDTVAVVTQNLLIDSNGKVVPTTLTYEVQMRTFVKDKDGKLVKTEVKQYELSRRLLLNDPKSGGFLAVDGKAPAYLPSAGNGYAFASQNPTEPILVRLGTRCMACHGRDGQVVLTFSRHDRLPPVALLKTSDNEHARYVIEQKLSREDFKSLQKRWKKE